MGKLCATNTTMMIAEIFIMLPRFKSEEGESSSPRKRVKEEVVGEWRGEGKEVVGEVEGWRSKEWRGDRNNNSDVALGSSYYGADQLHLHHHI